MNISHDDYGSKGVLLLHHDNQLMGKMTYSKAGESLIIIDSTHVEDAYHGQNVGKTLLQAAVDFAREHQLKILPLCPFAKAAFAKDVSLQDVLRS